MTTLTHIDDDRGRFAGLAAILLALLAYALIARHDDWKAGVDLVVLGLAAAIVLAPALALPRRDGPPAGWVSAMLVAGFFLAAGALFSLADVLGANTDDLHASTATWIATALAIAFGLLAVRRSSAVCTLLAAIAAVVAVVAAVDWVFSPESTSTFRYVMLALAIVLLAAGVALYRGRRDRHGVVLAVLSGFVVLALITTFAEDFLAPFFGGGGDDAPDGIAWGWELVLLAAGLALGAFAVLTREPGPGYTAVLLLLVFVGIIASTDQGFVGWPLVLALLTLLTLPGIFGLARIGPGPGPRHDPDQPHEVRL